MTNAPERKRRGPRDFVAYHEAGHAVVATYLGKRVTWVRIASSKDRVRYQYDGICRYARKRTFDWYTPDIFNEHDNWQGDRDLWTRDDIVAVILICFAGPIAEAKFKNRFRPIAEAKFKRRLRARGDANDWIHAEMAADLLCVPGPENKAYLEYLFHVTWNLLNNNSWLWRAVEKVAAELIDGRGRNWKVVSKIYEEVEKEFVLTHYTDALPGLHDVAARSGDACPFAKSQGDGFLIPLAARMPVRKCRKEMEDTSE